MSDSGIAEFGNKNINISVVYKYVLDVRKTRQVIDLPYKAKILKVGMLNDQFALWALIDKNEVKKIPHEFLILATGQEFPRELVTYIGSIDNKPSNIEVIFHVFETIFQEPTE